MTVRATCTYCEPPRLVLETDDYWAAMSALDTHVADHNTLFSLDTLDEQATAEGHHL